MKTKIAPRPFCLTALALLTLAVAEFRAHSATPLPNAWQITDNSTASGSVLYYTNLLSNAHRTAATNHGFRFRAQGRFVADFGGSKTMGMIYGLGTQRYQLWWYLDGNDDLVAEIQDGPSFLLTTNGTGSQYYHTHEFIYDPGSRRASYVMDGVAMVTNLAPNPLDWPAGSVYWGAGSSTGKGRMNFHRVSFEITNTTVALYDAGFADSPTPVPDPATNEWVRYPVTPLANTSATNVSSDLVPEPASMVVTTLAATNVQPLQALLSGTADAGGLGAQGWFEWGTTMDYGNRTAPQFLKAGAGTIRLSLTLTGLIPGTTYHVRCVGTNLLGAAYGQDVGFTAPQPPQLQQQSGGFWGYINMQNSPVPSCYGYGVSFYSATWPLLERPLAGFQMGLPSTWISPENTTFPLALCPPGTKAYTWPNPGNYQTFFQTIEGGMGFWGSTQFGATSPKFRMNGTPDCYDDEISSPGWGFGNPVSLPIEKMGIAQLCNRLLVPPDGLTFRNGMNGELLGTAWMAMPYTEIVPQDEEYFALTTAFVECEKLFLEGNKVAAGADLGGAAFMAPPPSTNTVASGQLWKMIPAGGEYFALTTAFVEGDGLFLEGNKVAAGADLGGAAFMAQRFSSNTFSSGQLWKKVRGTNPPPAHTGPLSWTLFVNSGNFKGPIAFWIPETWSRLSDSYPVVEGRGLDTRPGLMQSGAMEINTVPYFQATNQGDVYMRIPKLLFPVDTNGNTSLMQDVKMYASGALYDQARAWFNGGEQISGRFNDDASITPNSTALPLDFRKGQNGPQITGYSSLVETKSLTNGSFGLKWNNPTNQGSLPEYFKQVGNQFVPVAASEVPDETYLKSQSFQRADVGQSYTSSGAQWTSPGPASSFFEARLSDGTKVTYAWYRFVDQPALQHLNLSPAQKQRWQSIVEQIHTNWPTGNAYMAPPNRGTLATLDSALLVTPPVGLEVGYVPIVTKQEMGVSGVYTQLTALQLEGRYQRNPVENGYHIGTVTLGNGTYYWTNQAGYSWSLAPDLANGVFLPGPDYPYPGSIEIRLKRDPITDEVLPQVDGLMIAGEFYTRLSGLSGRPYLTAKRGGGKIIVSWDAGQTLQAATNVTGPWVPVIGAQNPYSVNANDPQRFFRVVIP